MIKKNVDLKQMTGGQAVVKCLENQNVEKIFCVPGESYLPVLDALYDSKKIEVITTRHESGASFIAEGYAKAKRETGVCMATRGPGATNLSIGVHTAYHDSTPMVVFLGQVESTSRGKEAFQEIDFVQYFQSISKLIVEIQDSKRIPEIVEKAFKVANSGRPGPVVISLPEDILYQEAIMKFSNVPEKPRPVPSLDELKNVEKLLNQADKPLIISGGGVQLSNAESELISFAEKNYIPVMTSFCRHSAFPNDHFLYTGHLGFSTKPEILDTVSESDVIIAIGTRLSDATTQNFKLISPKKTLIQIDIDPNVLTQSNTPTLGIVADAKTGLEVLLNMKINIKWKTWVAQKRDVYIRNTTIDLEKNDYINMHVIDILEKILPDESSITMDAGNFAGWPHTFMKYNQSRQFYGSTNGAMGYALPAALGVKVANPNRTVISFSGDGGFMMTSQEIVTSVYYKIPVISLVFNNQMLGTIRSHQEKQYPERVIATDLGNVSFSKMAKSMGAKGFVVRTRQEFLDAIKQALDNPSKTTLIEIINEQEQILTNKTIEDLRTQK